MLERCYCMKYQTKYPTYKGCTVCDHWHNFQNFAKWFDDNYIHGYQIDKDIKVNGNKVYSPETCVFVSGAENTIKARAKHYSFTSPNGKITQVYNLSEFCRKNNLGQGNMSAVHRGERSQHKGWRKA